MGLKGQFHLAKLDRAMVPKCVSESVSSLADS